MGEQPKKSNKNEYLRRFETRLVRSPPVLTQEQLLLEHLETILLLEINLQLSKPITLSEVLG
jgi:hypothetical protein